MGGMSPYQNTGLFSNDPICVVPNNGANGIIIFGTDSSSHLISTTYDGSSILTTVITTSYTAFNLHAIYAPDGSLYLAFRNMTSLNIGVIIKSSSGTWNTTPTAIGAYAIPMLVLMSSGAIWLYCIDPSSGTYDKVVYSSSYSTIPQKTAFAPVGAGIAEVGQNSNGYYIRFKLGIGYGIQICWANGLHTNTFVNSNELDYYGPPPAAFYSSGLVTVLSILDTTVFYNSSGSLVGYASPSAISNYNSGGIGIGFYDRNVAPYRSGHYHVFGYLAIGLYSE